MRKSFMVQEKKLPLTLQFMILSVVEQTDEGVGHQKVNVYIFHCRNDPLDLFFFICKRKCIKKVLGQSGCKLEMKMPAFAKVSAGVGR